MPSHEQIIADQAQVFSDFPTEPITISGATYNCLVLDFKQGNEWQDGGGYLDDFEVQVAIERSAIDAAIPAQGTLATFRSTSFRIGKVESDDKAGSVILNLSNTTT